VSRTELHLDATPAAVFDVLADGVRYADWVVGAKRIRRIEGDFPAPGSVLHNVVGPPLVSVPGSTTVVESAPPRHLLLEARVGPFTARVRFELVPDLPGTLVAMDEVGANRFSRALLRLTRPLVLARNGETLWRLRTQVANAGDVERPVPTGAETRRPLPRWLADTTARVFGAIAALRRSRALHPRGVTFRARARLTAAGAMLADGDGGHEAVVRFSRGAGLPVRVPDINGVAVRLVDARGPGRHRDLLFSSAGPGVLRRVLAPSVDFGSARFSYHHRVRVPRQQQSEHVTQVADVSATEARPLTLGELRRGIPVEVAIATVDGDGARTELGCVTASERVDGDEVHFSPVTDDDVLVPLGLLNALRAPAYAASRAVTADRAVQS
jgi:hypothetical protein